MNVIDNEYLGNIDGFDVYLNIAEDDETSVTDYDCYSAADAHAWMRGDWRFVNLVVSVHDEDDILGWSHLGACEYGTFSNGKYINPLHDPSYRNTEVVDDMVAEAMEMARETVAGWSK